MELEKSRDRADVELDVARAQLAPHLAQRTQVREAAERMNTGIASVYVNRVAARSAIREFAERAGVSAAAREVAEHPEQFGMLRGTEVGPIRSAERKEALRRAEALSRECAEYFGDRAVARERRPELVEARTAVREAEARARTLDAELSRTPGIAQLRLQVAEKLRSIQPQRRQEMSLRLSPAERLLLGASMAVGVAFVREQGHER